ncbi:hypothetical protein F4808DRAFT_434120 [Astrocystis sublimbata]|nr:hypothetical protein F4808DRAFT_434120 [Astrocystis sublimbata]
MGRLSTYEPKTKRPKRDTEALRKRIHEGKALLDKFGANYTKRQLFEHFGVNDRTGYRLLREDARHIPNSPFLNETRGRKRYFTEAQIDQMVDFLEREAWESRTLPWQSLPQASGIEYPEDAQQPDHKTVRRAINSRGWHKCQQCTKFWVQYGAADRHEWLVRRETFAREMLNQLGGNPENYRHIRYSNELHFTFGYQGKFTVTRRAGERFCTDCFQHRTRTVESASRPPCLNAWVCIGHDFKSKLIFYNVDNTNSALTMGAYRDQVLEPHVKKWLERGDHFVLEDGIAVPGSQFENNIVNQWKAEHGLQCFSSSAEAPDIGLLDSCWKRPKMANRKQKIPPRDEETLRNLAIDGWDALSQAAINEWCDAMPSRLLDIVNANGQEVPNESEREVSNANEEDAMNDSEQEPSHANDQDAMEESEQGVSHPDEQELSYASDQGPSHPSEQDAVPSVASGFPE